MEQYQELEEHRLKAKKKMNKYNIVIIVVSILLVLAAFTIASPFIIIVLIMMSFVLKSRHDVSKQYAMQFKEEVVSKIIYNKFEDAIYEPKKGFPLDIVNKVGFFKAPDQFHSEDLVKASYKGVNFYFSDVKLDKNNQNNELHTYFKGRFIVINFERKFNETVKIVEKKAVGIFDSFSDGLEDVYLESQDFNDKFMVYTTNPQMAFYVLTPQMQEKLLELEKKFEGNIYYSFMGGKFYVAINDFKDSFEHSIKEPITQEHLDRILNQLDLIPAIINELNFHDSIKYTGVKK